MPSVSSSMARGWSPAGRMGVTTSKRGTLRWYRGGVPGPTRARRRPEPPGAQRVVGGQARSTSHTRSTSETRWSRSEELSMTRSAPSTALLAAGLRRHPGLGVVAREPPLAHQSLHRGLDGAVDHDHDVEREDLAVRRLEQGDVEHDHRVTPLLRGAPLRHDGTDGGVGDGVEGGHRLGVGEGQRGQRGTIDGAVRRQDAGPEPVDERLVGRPAGDDHLPGDAVGVDEDRPPVHQELPHRRLARPDPAGQPHRQHGATRRGASWRPPPPRGRRGPPPRWPPRSAPRRAAAPPGPGAPAGPGR